MARIRTIKPEFFTSLTISDLPLTARLTFIGLWTHADDSGRCVDDARLIKAAVWPLDDRTAADVEVDLQALSERSLIIRYALNRKRYLAVTGWSEHQRINRPTKSKFPAPEEGELVDAEPLTCENRDSLKAHAHLSEDSPQERNREGNREQGTGRGESAPASDPPPPPPAPSSPPQRSADRPTPAPIDDAGFELTDALRRWAVSTFGDTVDLEHETALFLDHYRANGGNRRNWPAEWQKWIRRSAKWKSERPPLQAVSGGWQPWTNPTDPDVLADYENGW